jgi:uncharacterized protein YjeT (DUF2065 family)
MSDLIVGVGLVFVFEGLMWAFAPNAVKTFFDVVNAAPVSAMRQTGWIAITVGLFIVWLVRG